MGENSPQETRRLAGGQARFPLVPSCTPTTSSLLDRKLRVAPCGLVR
jgi:hypothetical protein